ncbi:hypothetical protein E0485_22640 [Paenibacillus albiflavus]|uniref:Uncharacterized protein n=1 Tax=Paenibacillus albiflavus TaxID=2545760 RepID=A0A4V2WMP4_9BACL|nr:hypothetical protein [Paenibacillus albiflavus]TCZ71452.1 hypothetical protein E0485_22640 [Paenibacillus albiflavus]
MEGQEQLSRYADHLTSYKERGYQTYLIYITQYYDPKVNGATASFHAHRLYQVYDWLVRHQDVFTCKILEDMEGMKLTDRRRFMPQDIYALQQMGRLQLML